MRVEEVYHPRIDPAALRSLSVVDVWRWLRAALLNWCIIAIAVAAFAARPVWWVCLPAIVVIGARQHALGILVHEGVHFRVCASHRWNDALSDCLAGYPLLTPTAGYRWFHLKHHQFLDTPLDPEQITVRRFPMEWSFPMKPWRFLLLLMRDLSGLWPVPLFVLSRLIWTFPGRRPHLVGVAAFHIAAAGVAAAGGRLTYLLLLWWVPMLTVFPFCFRIRTAAEHSALPGGDRRYTRAAVDVLRSTRTVFANALDRIFLGPHNVSYHIEHHLYPSVPFYRLADLAKILRQDREFAARSEEARSYWNVIAGFGNPRA